MKLNLNRTALAAGVVVGVMALAACGSNDNDTSSNKGDTAAASSSDTSSSDSGASSAATSSASKAGAGAGSSGAACVKGTVQAEGSTAQKNAINQWIKDYQNKCKGATVNYNPTGSGSGVKNFTGGQVDFAGSDAALSPDKGEVTAAQKQCKSTPLDLPMVVGPVAIAYKLGGVDNLILTPSVTAQIFQGKIKKWNDAAISKLNPGAKLPSTDIKVFFRSEESGTTQNFETYLSKAAPADYKAEPSKKWSGSVGEGKKGSDGVQQGIQSAEGSIGYIEWSFAEAGGLQMAKLDNGGGPVALTADSASKAVAAAKVTGTGDDVTLSLDYATKTPGAYPLILVTYEIACEKYGDPAKGSLVKSFLTYTSGPGQTGLTKLGYAPLPAAIQQKVAASVAKIS